VVITESPLSHIAELDGALAAAVHEKVALNRVKLRGSDHFLKFLHVRGLDVNNV